MYIRIEFDPDNENTTSTQHLLLGIPNGTFLSSAGATVILSDEIQNASNNSIFFWYVDVNIINKCYGGVLYCFTDLLTYPGVNRIDVMPIEGCYYKENDAHTYESICRELLEFI